MNSRLLLLAAPALLLAACNESKDDDDRIATGKVLEGTISDAGLPLDTVTSQPPLAKPEVKPGAAASADEPEDPASVDAEQPVIESAVE